MYCKRNNERTSSYFPSAFLLACRLGTRNEERCAANMTRMEQARSVVLVLREPGFAAAAPCSLFRPLFVLQRALQGDQREDI